MKNLYGESGESYFETKNANAEMEMEEKIRQMKELDQNNPLAEMATQMAKIAAQKRMRRNQ